MKISDLFEASVNIKGFWITDKGEFINCDYENDIHHADLLSQHFNVPKHIDNEREINWSVYDQNINMALEKGWVRCSSTVGNKPQLNIQWDSILSLETKRALLKWLSEYGKMFTTLHIDKPFTTGSDYLNDPNRFYSEIKRQINNNDTSLKEYKIEKAVVGRNKHEIVVYKNPKYTEMQDLYNKHNTVELRAILDQSSNLYVWDTAYGIHDEVAKNLGIRMKYKLYIQPPNNVVVIKPDDITERRYPASREFLESNPILARAIKPRIREMAYGGVNKENSNIWWHGSASNDLRGGTTGLHLGTKQAATDALCARIGFPAKGYWDGTREYGKTLLAGKKSINKMGKYLITGHNCDAPEEDYYIDQYPNPTKYPNGEKMPWDVKPSIKPFKIVGKMTNTPYSPHNDWKANGYMKASLRKGNARNGYYYKNEGEDSGSISAVVPNGDHVQAIPIEENFITEIERGGFIDSSSLDDYQYDLDKEYVDPDSDQIDMFPETLSNLNKNYDIVGKIGNYRVIKEKEHVRENDILAFILMDGEDVIAWVCLTPIESRNVNYPNRLRGLRYSLHGKGLQISGVLVDRKYAGQNLALKLYEWLLRNVCDFIVSDETQRSGGEAIWRKMLNSRKFDVMVFDDEKDISRKRWLGKDWGKVYDSNKAFRLIPWVTLAGKSDKIIWDE